MILTPKVTINGSILPLKTKNLKLITLFPLLTFVKILVLLKKV